MRSPVDGVSGSSSFYRAGSPSSRRSSSATACPTASGVHCAIPLLTGSSVEGTWYDRTLEYNAFLRGKELEKGESASRETVHLSPLPCWKHLSEEAYRTRIAEIVREINESGAAARAESQIPPLGPAGVQAQNPETRPKKIKKSPAPFCHALRKKVRQALWEAYGLFVAAYREAAESQGVLRKGWTLLRPYSRTYS